MLVVSSGDAQPAALKGEIVDYTGRELRLRSTSGLERTISAARVVSVSTTWSPDHQAGDALFAQHDFRQALEKYRAALDRKNAAYEKREWAQRQIVVQMIWCYRALGLSEQAGDLFVVITERDPATRSFDAIPLAWIASEPSPALEARAKDWLAREGRPVAQLLGASHLLATAQRPAALATLERLSVDRDERIAWLAQTQIWRTSSFRMTPDQFTGWERKIDRIPEPLRAGAYFVLGKAMSNDAPRNAAIVLMRVPVLYPRERQLAAESLLVAGDCLERTQQPSEALQVYRELATSHAATPQSAAASRRIAALQNPPARSAAP